MLTLSQINKFNRDGYLHIPKFWSNKICEELRHQIRIHYQNFNESLYSIFTTDKEKRIIDDYFLDSGDKIRCFFEEDAFTFDPKYNKIQLSNKIENSINKIGHALHTNDPLFHKHSYSPKVIHILKSLKYTKPAGVQSMYIFKQPTIGGEVHPHQDGTFLYTKPQSVLGFWWALEDCDTINGCLYGVPGSHHIGVQQLFKRNFDNNEPLTKRTIFDPEKPLKELTEYMNKSISIPVKKGDLILLHHAFIHFSKKNVSNKSRHAYTMHIIETDNTIYPKENWLQLSKEKDFLRFY